MHSQKKQKRVVILINTLLHGGAERMVFDISDKINKSEFNIHVVYMKSHEYFQGGTESLLEDIEKTGVRISSLGGKNRSVFRESIRLWKLLRREKPDVLHTFLPYAGTVGRVVGHLAGVKSILSVQCNLPLAYSKKVYFLDWITLFFANAWTAASVGIEEAYAGSSVAFSDIEWNKGRRHFSVVSGVDIDDIERVVKKTNIEKKRNELGIKKGHQLVSMTSRLISWKGHDDLLDAFALIQKNTELLLIGGGPRKDELMARAERLGVTDRVHFLGNRSDLFELMAITDVYVQSYCKARDGSIWKGPNTSQMVAAAAGVPAISTNVPLIEQFMQDHISGRIACHDNPKDLAEKIDWLLNNRGEAKEMAIKARDVVKDNYSLNAMVSSYENIYRRLARR